MGLYVETRVRADLETLWEHTQEPARHQRWDLRFTEIAYLPRAEGEPQHFRYATRVLPFLVVAGTGVSAGSATGPTATGSPHSGSPRRTRSRSSPRAAATGATSPPRTASASSPATTTGPAGAAPAASPTGSCSGPSWAGPPPGPSTGCGSGASGESPPNARSATGSSNSPPGSSSWPRPRRSPRCRSPCRSPSSGSPPPCSYRPPRAPPPPGAVCAPRPPAPGSPGSSPPWSPPAGPVTPPSRSSHDLDLPHRHGGRGLRAPAPRAPAALLRRARERRAVRRAGCHGPDLARQGRREAVPRGRRAAEHPAAPHRPERPLHHRERALHGLVRAGDRHLRPDLRPVRRAPALRRHHGPQPRAGLRPRLPRHPPAPRQRSAPVRRAGRLAPHPLRRTPLPRGPVGRAGPGTGRRPGRGARVLRRAHRPLPHQRTGGQPVLRPALRIPGVVHRRVRGRTLPGVRAGLRPVREEVRA